VLDGFIITAGQANGSYPHNYGGGMYNNSGSPTLTNVTFSGNTATPMAAGCTTQQQPDADERHLQRQFCRFNRRGDIQLLQQPDADERHLQRQHRW
jgi:hypothetical protein